MFSGHLTHVDGLGCILTTSITKGHQLPTKLCVSVCVHVQRILYSYTYMYMYVWTSLQYFSTDICNGQETLYN